MVSVSQNDIRTTRFILTVIFVALVSFVAYAPHAEASAITSNACAGGCNWSATASWSGAVVPGTGDTVTIADGATVTVDNNRIVGDSTTITPAINLGNSGKLVIATGATLIVRGNVLFTGGGALPAVTMNAGSSWQFDSSLAASPSTTKFYFGGTGYTELRPFIINGTSAQHVSVSSNAAGGNGYFTLQPGFFYGFPFTATYADFLRIGDATNPGWNLQSYYSSSNWTVTHSTFTNCGAVDWHTLGLHAGATFIHDYNVHTGTLSPQVVLVDTQNPMTSGAREIIGNVFDAPFGNGNLSFQDFTITDNYFGGRIYVNQSGTWAAFARNFDHSQSTSTNDTLMLAAGNMNDNYMSWDSDVGNPHWVIVSRLTSSTFDGQIFDQTGHTTGDVGDLYLSNTISTPLVYTITHNVSVPDSANVMPGDMVTMFGSTPNASFNINHNTGFLNQYGFIDFETGVVTTGTLLSLKDNIMWGNVGNTFYKIFDPNSALDAANPANVDFNVGVNYTAVNVGCGGCTTQAQGYATKWSSSPPATHDIDLASPSLVDTTRNLATFDGAYFGNSYAAWNSSGAYTMGSFVSNGVAGFYGGTSINYRCFNASGCNGAIANSQPGSGSMWRYYWELASLNDIRNGVANQTIYQPNKINGLASASTIIPMLNSWVRRGFSSTNAAIRSAASDGSDIGATSFVDLTPPGVTVTVPISGATVAGSSVTLTATSTDDVAVTNVQFKVDGVNVGASGATSPYSITWNSKSVADGVHTISAVANDAALNYATSSISVTVRNAGPVISLISSGTPTTTSATITWTTDENATSVINYGPTVGYGSASSSAALVTSHSVTLTGLTPSTTYHFQVQSVDAQSNTSTSIDQVFVTPDVSAPTVNLTAPSAGATVAGSSVTLTATSVDDIGVTGVQFKIDGVNVGASGATSPYSITWDSSSVADGAHTISAVAHDAALNYATSSISVTVTNAVAVVAKPSVGSGGIVSGVFSYGFPVPPALANAPSQPTSNAAAPASASQGTAKAPAAAFSFQKNLSYRMTSTDVQKLQKYLNSHGYILAKTGPGSPGKETTYFGAALRDALIRFQNAHAAQILKPSGLTKGNGVFGPDTRAYVNSTL